MMDRGGVFVKMLYQKREDYVMYPNEMTTSLCIWNSRNPSRKQLLSLGHNMQSFVIYMSFAHPFSLIPGLL
ncbi:Hypothetical predicted protein [Cloeon dipterum]|uniref:Uncharacterized protein n=1 Tax=Cloeon dipterum TaxID=197152 RepID=A0A8S1CJV9_9INSE|nr:Hypothetical predicted protein [Cloeon dipterum]